jgi:alkylhydroperoxidase family enzyme
MPRIPPLEYHQAGDAVRPEWDRQVAAHGRMTNMKRTLAHAPVALRALMEWYALRDEVVPFLGERLADVFSHAISSQTDCLICSTFFRRILIDRGEDPDALRLDERERLVVAFGRQLVTDANGISDELYAGLARHFDAAQIVTLTSFGALMVATNVFNNALRVDLDDYLAAYRRAGAPGHAPRSEDR